MTRPTTAFVARNTAIVRLLVALVVAASWLLAGNLPSEAQQLPRRTQITRLLKDTARAGPVMRVRGDLAQAVPQEASNVQLAAGEMLATRLSATAMRVVDVSPLTAHTTPTAANEKAVALPFRYVTPATDGELVTLRPIYFPNRRLRYDSVAKLFRGSFYIALEDTTQPGRSRRLTAAVRLQVAADADSLRPAVLEFSHTNLPLAEVAVMSGRAQDSLRVRIIPDFDLNGVDVWLPVAPSLAFESRPARLAGLGIGSTRLTLAVRGGHLAAPARVRLEARPGTVEPEEVELGPDGIASVRVRSAGIGPATVRAISPELGNAEIRLRFTWPWLFLLASLLGGGLGALLRYMYVRRNEDAASLQSHVITGVLSGFLAAVIYYALGVNLLDVKIDVRYLDEAAVFAFAALAGLLGMPAVNAAAKALTRR